MSRTPVRRLVLGAAVVALAACGPATTPAGTPPGATSPRDTSFVRPLYGPTWTLTRLRGAPAPTGAGARAATLIFYSGSERRAAGFAGCNQWSSTYTFGARDSVAFTPPVATKMACTDGMSLERDFLGIIERAIRIAQKDSTLVLTTAMRDSAVFVAR